MTIIPEFHTSHLSDPCAMHVKLTADGKRLAETTGAMFRGSVFHAAVALYIRAGLAAGTEPACVAKGAEQVKADAIRDHCPLTEAVVANEVDTRAECVKLLANFGGRFRDMFRASKVIGCELPCRWNVDIDGVPTSFATHLDLLMIDGNGELMLWDFKTGEDAPTRDFLGRNLQFGLMWLMVRYGAVCVDADMGLWESMGMFPRVSWIHVNDLAPYSRATTTKGDDGQERQFVKGDDRPLKSIVRPAMFAESNAGLVRDEIFQRVRQYRAGYFPMNPDELGCFLCDTRGACPNFGRSDER